ncbi:hypothetical protein [Sporomusa sp.]|uniref:hypothetical protein n=1 Tax=Sporomusa sp. TaxID=2078658 RepID=UPI002BF4065C|nr:hypothetical protein [Sporomusa sp.]HWR41789.1 hypothetical protein [Sporomusa sp.]
MAKDLSGAQNRYREYIGLSELQQPPGHTDSRGMISSVVEVERKKMSLEECRAFVAKHIPQIHHEQTGGRGKENSARNRLVKELRCNSNLSLKEIGKLVELRESRVSRIIKSAEK